MKRDIFSYLQNFLLVYIEYFFPFPSKIGGKKYFPPWTIF